jgi:hypothetical protein
MKQAKSNNEVATPRFSLIIPIYQRGDIVLVPVRAPEGKNIDDSFEVIIIIHDSIGGSEFKSWYE